MPPVTPTRTRAMPEFCPFAAASSRLRPKGRRPVRAKPHWPQAELTLVGTRQRHHQRTPTEARRKPVRVRGLCLHTFPATRRTQLQVKASAFTWVLVLQLAFGDFLEGHSEVVLRA